MKNDTHGIPKSIDRPASSRIALPSRLRLSTCLTKEAIPLATTADPTTETNVVNPEPPPDRRFLLSVFLRVWRHFQLLIETLVYVHVSVRNAMDDAVAWYHTAQRTDLMMFENISES